MPDSANKKVETNPTPNSCVDVTCDCSILWSLAQQFSTTRLCVSTGEHSGDLLEDYAVRARRIAATYARFYLETEDGGDKKKIGRYYWMALGAFASKTVACTLEAWQVRLMFLATATVTEGLGKGNFWLFYDISGWHWYHNNFSSSFEKCMNERNTNTYSKKAKEETKKLPWNTHALPIISNMAPSEHIREGFRYVKEFEKTTDPENRRAIQYKHLIAIADHEQRIVLQPLIYANPDFANWVKKQRAPYASWASPALEVTFASTCKTEKDDMKSRAPCDTALEDVKSRMKWIGMVASQFHELMTKKKKEMHTELELIAAWVDMADIISTSDAMAREGNAI